MNSIDVYEKLMGKLATRIVNRLMSEHSWERETVAQQVELAKYVRERFNRYLNSHRTRNAQNVVIFIDKVNMVRF